MEREHQGDATTLFLDLLQQTHPDILPVCVAIDLQLLRLRIQLGFSVSPNKSMARIVVSKTQIFR